MRLWKCTCEIEVLIASEEEPTGYEIADAASDEMRDNSLDCCEAFGPEEITDLKEIPKSWLDSSPRGECQDKTCEQIVTERLEELEAEALRTPMPNQMPLPLDLEIPAGGCGP